MLLSRQARYSGLIDVLHFSESPLGDAMAGATTWLAVNAEEAALERGMEVEKEMQQWTKRRSEGDAERFLRLDGVAERCQHALVRCGHALLHGAIFLCVKNDDFPRQAQIKRKGV